MSDMPPNPLPPPGPPPGPAPYDGAPNPYGGAPNPYGGADSGPAAPMDGVSIGSLVTALLCCTGPVGVVLGIVGIARTRDGRRRGRWMSVVGVVVGVLATLGVVAAGIGTFWFATEAVITPRNAEAGQCVVVESEEDVVTMVKWSCTQAHNGEIIHVGRYDESADGEHTDSRGTTTSICFDQVSPEDTATLTDAGFPPEAWDVMVEDPGDLSDGDAYVCYVESQDELTEPLLDHSGNV
jgi:hypothetical protein